MPAVLWVGLHHGRTCMPWINRLVAMPGSPLPRLLWDPDLIAESHEHHILCMEC